MSPTEVKPVAAATAPGLEALPVNPTGQPYTYAQRAWLNFVDKVKRGEQKDPTGQYVADGTIMPASDRQSRPKLDAATDSYPFRLTLDGTIVRAVMGKYPQPTDPPVDCTDPNNECPPTGPGVTSRFVSSVNNGSGPIFDLKVARDKPYYLGYSILYTDLNSGAGGDEIYYQFTRDPNSVLKGLEYYDGRTTYSVFDPVVRYETKNGNFFGAPSRNQYFWPIWSSNGVAAQYAYWSQYDLNDGAGGEYIYSYNSKDRIVTRSGVTTVYPVIQEVGILSGNSSSIQPPAGWTKYPADLNEGAGGDFIYFCYKM